ncbi:unnamed protein product [Choristocarpus tenellus]
MSEELEMLIGMGFDKELSKAALKAHDGNVQAACDSLLFQGTADNTPQTTYRAIQGSISQYDLPHGRSACTCICLEASMAMLSRLQDRPQTLEEVTDDITTPDAISSIVEVGVITYEAVVAGGLVEAEHTSVPELLDCVTRYKEGLRRALGIGVYQGVLGSSNSFTTLLHNCREGAGGDAFHTAVTITKPPETVVAFLPPKTKSSGSVQGFPAYSCPEPWLLFDSHSRPHLGFTGAHVRVFESESALVSALEELFPPLREEVGGGGGGFLESMYNMIETVPLRLVV